MKRRLTSGADTLVWLAVLAETVVLGWLVVRHADACCGCWWLVGLVALWLI